MPPALDPEFEASERLFRRIHPSHLIDGLVAEAFLPFPAFSVNREKYSRPEEVLQGHSSFGIAAFRVVDIPERLQDPNGTTYWFGVEHRPEPDNYSHSEVHSYLEGESREPSKTVRKQFRELLRRRIVILQEPSR